MHGGAKKKKRPHSTEFGVAVEPETFCEVIKDPDHYTTESYHNSSNLIIIHEDNNQTKEMTVTQQARPQIKRWTRKENGGY